MTVYLTESLTERNVYIMSSGLSYEKAGVSIDTADSAKREIADILCTNNSRVLNRVGAFASLFDAKFPEYKEPVMVLKAEEPGSKQLLSIKHRKISWISYDLINHLTNDIIVMGAKPLIVLDTIICGKLQKDIVVELVANMSKACNELGCILIGGETSEQPGVLQVGNYVLTASVVGIMEKSKIIDGSRIEEGDVLLALPSNGLHTNGYTLVRKLIDETPGILNMQVEGDSFLENVLKPHKSYYNYIRSVLESPYESDVHGMVHITGGGIRDNLIRILPEQYKAVVDLSRVKVLPVFKLLHKMGSIPCTDMLRTFNIGVGLIMVVSEKKAQDIKKILLSVDCDAYEIGYIVRANKDIEFQNEIKL